MTAPAPARTLRRSTTDRVGAGVAGGLGEYFDVDPILFRVLFAVSAFFGGAGIVAYLAAWALIPTAGTEHAYVDRWLVHVRTWRVPPWVVAVAAGLVLWGLAFSWWAPWGFPGPHHFFFPVLVAVVIALVLLRRREPHPPSRQVSTPVQGPWAAPAGVAPTAVLAETGTATDPTVGQSRSDATRVWMSEAKAASAERRRRAWPLRNGALAIWVATITVLGICDAVGGIRLPVYFWVTGGIALAALLVGFALRRTPWSMLSLVFLGLIGTVAFGNTGASLHDGVGQRVLVPVSESELAADHRLAFGQTVLDLRSVAPAQAHDISITQAAGQVRILLPRSMNATVLTRVRMGQVSVDGGTYEYDSDWVGPHGAGGIGIERTIRPLTGATGPAITIDVHLANGEVAVDRS